MTYSFSEEVKRLNPELAAQLKTATPSKYKNARTEAKGMSFQSGHEAAEIGKLILADEHKAGVFGLRLQVNFPLPGGVIYRADATYLDEHLIGHVVDCKGVRTKDYLIKKKLFKATYGKDIEEL